MLRQLKDFIRKPKKHQPEDIDIQLQNEPKLTRLMSDASERQPKLRAPPKPVAPIAMLTKIDEDQLEGGQIVLPTKRQQPHKSIQFSNDVLGVVHVDKKRQSVTGSVTLTMRSSLVNGEVEELVTMQLGSNKSFDVPQSYIVEWSEFEPIHCVRDFKYQQLWLGVLKNHDLLVRHKLLSDQKVMVKFVISRPKEHEDVTHGRYLSELMILNHFLNLRNKNSTRVVKLLACTDPKANDINGQPMFAYVTALHPLTLTQFIDLHGKSFPYIDGVRTTDADVLNDMIQHRMFILTILQQISYVLSEIHKLGFVHNAICPDSVKLEMVLEQNGTSYKAVLSEFGQVQWIKNDKSDLIYQRSTGDQLFRELTVEQLPYVAPELVYSVGLLSFKTRSLDSLEADENDFLRVTSTSMDESQVKYRADLFSFASLAYFVIEERPPYPFRQSYQDDVLSIQYKEQIRADILSNDRPEFTFDGQLKINIKDEHDHFDTVMEIIQACWNKNERRRPSADIVQQSIQELIRQVSVATRKQKVVSVKAPDTLLRRKLKRLIEDSKSEQS